MSEPSKKIAKRFRGFLPVVIDVETGGLEPSTDALLEIAGVFIKMDDEGFCYPAEEFFYHVEAFEGANVTQETIKFLGYDPSTSLRFAINEQTMWQEALPLIDEKISEHKCQRAVLVGHNAFFDLSFIQQSLKRCGHKKNPFHAFTTLDTASLSGLVYGETVLAKACIRAQIDFDCYQAHSAQYDANKTAELFCKIVNTWQEIAGGPIKKPSKKATQSDN